VLFVYNAAPGSADSKPDMACRCKMVACMIQTCGHISLRKVSVEGIEDIYTSIPFAAEISLAGLPAGRYLLRVTAN